MKPIKKEDIIIAISSGGTGGHVFPAICLAEEMRKRGFSPVWYSDQRGDQYVPNSYLFSKRLIFHITQGEGKLNRLKQYATILKSTFQVLLSFFKQRPALVVGFGGYATAPVVLAAIILQIPIILHEQNAVLGKVNRWMARFAHMLALGFKKTQRVPPSLKAFYTGNPVREEIAQLQIQPFPTISEKLKILIIGGSQGAALFSSIIPEALALLPLALQQRIEIIQQARPELLTQTKHAYEKLNISATVCPFFEDITLRYDQAHLVICRAGAMTVAEVCLSHRPAIFVPLPSAMDNHQYFNAAELAEEGLGWRILQEDFTPQELASHLIKIFDNLSDLEEISQKMQKNYSPDATVKLANYLEDLLPEKR